MKWSFFAAAGLLAWYFLLTNGAPLAAVVAGTGLAALWNWFQRKKA